MIGTYFDVNFGRVALKGTFWFNVGRAARGACSGMWKFGYKLSIYSRPQENHGKL
jgi:hypothetical protein